MKKFTTKLAAVSMAAMMALSMTACSINITNTSDKKEDTQQEETIVNPVQEVSEEEMVQTIGIDLPLPTEAADAVYSIIDMPDNDIAQVDFTLDGEKIYLRACVTDLTEFNDLTDPSMANPNDLDLSVGDISGLNYKWNGTVVTDVQGREAMVNVSNKGPGYIAWLDVAPGILYNLCMEEKADLTKLQELAERLFVPMQGEAE